MRPEIIFEDPHKRIIITRSSTSHHGLWMSEIIHVDLVLTYFPGSREFVVVKNRYGTDLSTILYNVCKIPVTCRISGVWLEDSPAGMIAAMKYGL
jgi:hypothetical protein